MKKLILPVVLLLVGLGLGLSIPHGAKQEQKVGGAPANDRSFVYGLHVGQNDQYGIDGSGIVTASKYNTSSIGVSTSSSATLGGATAGFIAIPAASTTFFATSTAMDLNSQVFLTQLTTSTN